MSAPPRPIACFAPTLAAARAASSKRPGWMPASPREPRALERALEHGLPVRFLARRGDRRFWRQIERRYLLPAAPALLRRAIEGISRRPGESGDSPGRGGAGAARAMLVEGVLDDARMRRLLSAADVPRLWILEDFRRLSLSGRALERLYGHGIRLAVMRPLRARRIFLR